MQSAKLIRNETDNYVVKNIIFKIRFLNVHGPIFLIKFWTMICQVYNENVVKVHFMIENVSPY